MAMSRMAVAAMLASLCAGSPAFAQSEPAEPDSNTQEVLDAAREAYGPPPPKPAPRCDPGEDGTIVVCARRPDDPEKYRIASDTELGINTDDGLPRAPDLEPKYPGPVVARGCFIPPCPKPPAYIIDFASLPDTPPGSDADRVGHGLVPLDDPNAPTPQSEPVDNPVARDPEPEG
ncbi:hypothetical protein [Qipengyuania sp. JC766]|uniref:hypothetical protein n=1 Tax=Qipengyuania sp. JC766 TaxID=3232139 RepID=UPI0034585449